MDLATFLRFAKRYNDLGWSVQEQLQDVAQGDSMSDQNSNALYMIARFLRNIADDVEDAKELAEEIEQFLLENPRSHRLITNAFKTENRSEINAQCS
jgi:hypothetical protein